MRCCQSLHDGWDEVLRQQREYLDNFWKHADIEIEGDAELQNAARFALFHVLQSAARNEGRAVPAKGLTGPGYDGHTFWDTESFVLPVLTYTDPPAVRDVLRWRHRTLGRAKERAEQLNLQGRGIPLADDPRRGMLRLLAGRDGRVPYQRGHRGRRLAVLQRDAGR